MTGVDLPYLLLEWFAVNVIWRGRPSRSDPAPSLYPEAERLRCLRSALNSGMNVVITYIAAGSGEETVRVVTPENLRQAGGGHWLLTGHDHLRGARRTFRVDRIKDVRVNPPA